MNEGTSGFSEEKNPATSITPQPFDHTSRVQPEALAERSVIPSLTLPWIPKWPPIIPPILFPIIYASGERSIEGSSQFNMQDYLRMMEILYLRPDIRSAVVANTQTLLDLLSHDKEAADAFYQVLGIKSDERVPPLVVLGVCIAAGAVVGYFSR